MSTTHDADDGRTDDEPAGYEIDKRMFDSLEIKVYETKDGDIEVRVIKDGFGKTECVAHLVEDGRRGVSEGTWYLPFMVDELRSLEICGIMDGEIGYIRSIREVKGPGDENLTYDRLRDTDDYPQYQVRNRMPESSFRGMKAAGDGFTGLNVLYGEEWLHGLRQYFERRTVDDGTEDDR